MSDATAPFSSTWRSCFDLQSFIEVRDQRFCVYSSNDSRYDAARVTIVLMHGGGESSLSWALVANQLRSSHHRIIAFDHRCHGLTTASSTASREDETEAAATIDLSLATLSNDTTSLLQLLSHEGERFLLVGHSMSGSVATAVAEAISSNIQNSSDSHSSNDNQCDRFPSLSIAGVVVVDLVEGSAIASMDHIEKYLRSRPQSFLTVAAAVEWSVTSRMINNIVSAQLSIPPQLKAAADVAGVAGGFVWRTDLLQSRCHWLGWFTDLNTRLLLLSAPKLLLLASTDRLDAPMLVAQMQGKIRIELLRDVGHALQQEKPAETATLLMAFIHRHIHAR